MPDLLVRSFAPLLLAFQSCFTQPSFDSFWALACAWILCSGRRSLTRVIQSAQLTQVQTLLLLPPLLQPSPLGPRRSGPLCLPTAVTFLCRGLGRCRR